MAAKSNISRVEINTRRLLEKCEQMMTDCEEESEGFWRMHRYVKTLEEFVDELKVNNGLVSKECVDNYNRRVMFLKGLLQTKTIVDSLDKAFAARMLSPPTNNDSVSKDIHRKTIVHCENELRDELFENNQNSTLTRRNVVNEPSGSQELDSTLKYHNDRQEHLAADMLAMTQRMKEQSELAGKIMKQDIKRLEKSSTIMDKNQSNLGKQSNRLTDFIGKSSWHCWMWVVVAFVVVIFIKMILFIKITSKS